MPVTVLPRSFTHVVPCATSIAKANVGEDERCCLACDGPMDRARTVVCSQCETPTAA